MTMALVHYGYGDLAAADIRYEPVVLPAPGPLDVRVEVLESPINPSDVNMIEGRYVFQPPLPAVLGREGVGRVVAVGSAVTRCRLGDRVISIADHHPYGFWGTHTIGTEAHWWVVPDFIPTAVAVHLAINGLTAFLLLTEFVPLVSGAGIVQNAPNSSVGRWVSYFAMQMGLRCVVIDRDGGALDIPGIALGLNAVGGASAAAVSKSVAVGGTIVTYGAMSKEPPYISNSALIFKEQIFRGFLRSAWVSRYGPQAAEARLEQIAKILREAPFSTGLRHVFALNDYRNAFDCVMSAPQGKVVLSPLS